MENTPGRERSGRLLGRLRRIGGAAIRGIFDVSCLAVDVWESIQYGNAVERQVQAAGDAAVDSVTREADHIAQVLAAEQRWGDVEAAVSSLLWAPVLENTEPAVQAGLNQSLVYNSALAELN